MSSLTSCWAKQSRPLPLAALIGIALAFLIGFAAGNVLRTPLPSLVALTLGGLILPGVRGRIIRTTDAVGGMLRAAILLSHSCLLHYNYRSPSDVTILEASSMQIVTDFDAVLVNACTTRAMEHISSVGRQP